MLKKLNEIAQGILNSLNPNLPEDVKEVVAARMEICDSCPFKRGFQCGKCGCIIKSKCHSLNSRCPMGKWNPVFYQDKQVKDNGLK